MSNIDIVANVPSSMAAVFPFVGSVVLFMLGSKNLTSASQYAYAGEIISILFPQMAGVYAASRIIDSGLGIITFDFNTMTFKYNQNRFFWQYAGESGQGDSMGTTRLVNLFIFLLSDTIGAIIAYYGSYLMWSKIQQIEASQTEMTFVQGYLILTIGIVLALGSWAAAMTLGDNAVETFQWFYDYATRWESRWYWDDAGTSLERDYVIHFVTMFFSILSCFSIGIMSFYFAYDFLELTVKA